MNSPVLELPRPKKVKERSRASRKYRLTWLDPTPGSLVSTKTLSMSCKGFLFFVVLSAVLSPTGGTSVGRSRKRRNWRLTMRVSTLHRDETLGIYRRMRLRGIRTRPCGAVAC